MKNYKWILFDADETLFRFDAFSGLRLMFLQHGIKFTKRDYDEFQTVNKALWVEYQNGDITSQQLQHYRFSSWADKLKITPTDLNHAFQNKMAEICAPIEGAKSLLSKLKGKVKLGIITNGFTELQKARLERTGLKDHIDLLVISEQVGFAKPHPGIFKHALSNMGNLRPTEVLMVGDNPDTDILGGLNAGFDTCWFNVDNRPTPEGIIPQYQVSSLVELEDLLLGSND